MNIFRFELKSNIKSTIIWILAMCLTVYFFMMAFPAYSDNSQGIIKVLKNYPPELLKALGMDINQFFSSIGFYSFVLIYIELLAAMQAMMLALGTSGRELRTRTSEFLVTKPISRWTILAAKSSAVLVILVITNLSITLTSLYAVSAVTKEPFSVTALLMVCLSTFLLQLVFAAMGILLGVTFRKLRSVAPVSLGIVFGFYVVNMLKGIFDDKWIRYFSPFQFFEKYSIIATKSFDSVFLIWSVVLIVGMLIVGFVYYVKKDIHAV